MTIKQLLVCALVGGAIGTLTGLLGMPLAVGMTLSFLAGLTAMAIMLKGDIG